MAPPKGVDAGHVEEFSGRSVRAEGIPPDLAFVPHGASDQLRKLPNGRSSPVPMFTSSSPS